MYLIHVYLPKRFPKARERSLKEKVGRQKDRVVEQGSSPLLPPYFFPAHLLRVVHWKKDVAWTV